MESRPALRVAVCSLAGRVRVRAIVHRRDVEDIHLRLLEEALCAVVPVHKLSVIVEGRVGHRVSLQRMSAERPKGRVLARQFGQRCPPPTPGGVLGFPKDGDVAVSLCDRTDVLEHAVHPAILRNVGSGARDGDVHLA
eukprot:543074-Prymnesium_polylepis.1